MSKDWNVYCRTCKETHTFNDANHQTQLMRTIIKYKREIAAISELVKQDNIDLRTPYGYIDAEWFKKHVDHDLVPRSEYGEIDGTCGEAFECVNCKARHYCALPIGHEGVHSRDA